VQLEASVSDQNFIWCALVVFSVTLIQVPFGRIDAHVGCLLGGCIGLIAVGSWPTTATVQLEASVSDPNFIWWVLVVVSVTLF